ncbi:MAG: hypothetical protein ABIH48_00200 [Candidatus Falkowbacteria bacterium]
MFSSLELFFITILILALFVVITWRRLNNIWQYSKIISCPPPQEAIDYGRENADKLLEASRDTMRRVLDGTLPKSDASAKSSYPKPTKFEWVIIRFLKYLKYGRTE